MDVRRSIGKGFPIGSGQSICRFGSASTPASVVRRRLFADSPCAHIGRRRGFAGGRLRIGARKMVAIYRQLCAHSVSAAADAALYAPMTAFAEKLSAVIIV